MKIKIKTWLLSHHLHRGTTELQRNKWFNGIDLFCHKFHVQTDFIQYTPEL